MSAFLLALASVVEILSTPAAGSTFKISFPRALTSVAKILLISASLLAFKILSSPVDTTRILPAPIVASKILSVAEILPVASPKILSSVEILLASAFAAQILLVAEILSAPALLPAAVPSLALKISSRFSADF